MLEPNAFTANTSSANAGPSSAGLYEYFRNSPKCVKEIQERLIRPGFVAELIQLGEGRFKTLARVSTDTPVHRLARA